ncbi:MAG: hypothetical protein D6722_10215 [Bacteroidetes bacterium]|nr:MAG: hypothetical protein D6722_10215 [Bacteroidota bacterium]
MQTKTHAAFLWLALGLLFVACTSENNQEQTAEPEVPAITLSPLSGSVDFPEATLALISAEPGDEGAYTFNFEVGGYELGVQTEPATPNGLANSDKGQHIHLIVDNGPYEAHYETSATTTKLAEPGNHVVLAFLSRSYHESVKNLDPAAASYVLTQIQTGEGEYEQADFSAPHMFYSRPKGTYTGAGTEKVLLDFFLLNVDLAPDGYKVRATINGEEFILTDWVPYVMEGLPMGENTVKLELLDAAGAVVPGPFNSVTRTFTLEPEAAQ